MGTALAGLAALAIAMGIGRFAFTPLLPLMQADAGLSLAQGGWLAAANYAGYLAGALGASRAPLGIRGSLLAIAAATLAMAFLHPFPAQLALRAIAGAASAWVLVQVSAAVDARRSGLVYAGVGVGIVVAGLLCLVTPTSSAGWAVLGGIALLGLFLPLPRRKIHGGNGSTSRDWRLVIPYGAFGFGYILPATFLPAMARDIVAEAALFGWAWPVFGLAAALSTLVAGIFSRNTRVWALAQLVMAAGVVAPLAVPGLAGIVLSALAVGGTFMVITMAGMRAGAVHGTGQIALMTAAFAAGQIAGPLLVSFLGLSVEASLLAAGAVLAACVPMIPKGEKNERAPASA